MAGKNEGFVCWDSPGLSYECIYCHPEPLGILGGGKSNDQGGRSNEDDELVITFLEIIPFLDGKIFKKASTVQDGVIDDL